MGHFNMETYHLRPLRKSKNPHWGLFGPWQSCRYVTTWKKVESLKWSSQRTWLASIYLMRNQAPTSIPGCPWILLELIRSLWSLLDVSVLTQPCFMQVHPSLAVKRWSPGFSGSWSDEKQTTASSRSKRKVSIGWWICELIAWFGWCDWAHPHWPLVGSALRINIYPFFYPIL